MNLYVKKQNKSDKPLLLVFCVFFFAILKNIKHKSAAESSPDLVTVSLMLFL